MLLPRPRSRCRSPLLRGALGVLGWGAWLGSCPSAVASPAELFGNGAESIGKAGTGAASARGPSATYQNPAWLASGTKKRFRVAYGAATFDLQGKTPQNTYDLSDATGNVQFGLQVPFTLSEPMQDRLALGLDVVTPGSVIARVRILDAARPQFPLLADRAESLNLNTGAGVRLPLGFSLGAGLMLHASLQGSVGIEAGGSGTVVSSVDDELVLTSAPLFGAGWENRDVALGLVYRGELKSEFDLDVTLEDLGQIVLPPLSVTGLAQYDPAHVQFEVSLRPGPYQINVGVGRELWSRLGRLKGQTIDCAESASDTCEQRNVPDLGLRDTWVPRTSVSRRFEARRGVRLEPAVGYFYEQTPFPAQHETANLWDNPRHAVTAGVTVGLSDPLATLDVSFAVQRHLLVQRRHVKGDFAEFGDASTTGGIWVSVLSLEAAF